MPTFKQLTQLDPSLLSQATLQNTTDFDLLVVGSGAAGLSTALHAAVRGLRVCVLEKTPYIGGTSAVSGGWMWLPGNHLAKHAGIVDDTAQIYLKNELLNHHDDKRIARFLEVAPRALQAMENIGLQFIDGNTIPDFHGLQGGARTGGRSACAAPFDGTRLGPWLAKLRAPIPETTLWGMSIAAGADMRQFMKAGRSISALWYVGKRLLRYVGQRLRYGCNTHLVNGNALVAQLLYFCIQHGVTILTDQRVTRLRKLGDRVIGLEAEHTHYIARRAVVLAGGGFPHDASRQAQYAPFDAHHSAAPKSNTGDGLRLAEAVGGQIIQGADIAAAVAWAPVSQVPQSDGSEVNFPHLIERGKPGLIAVDRHGRRFSNEANSYYDMMAALLATGETEAYLIVDRRFLRRYGLGAVKPWPIPIRTFLKNGYLKQANTLQELGQVCGIDGEVLAQTVRQFNVHAERGEDPEFARGNTPYNRMQGDVEHQPNPCVAPIVQAPFYAVKIVLGSLGTFAGIVCNENGQVLNESKQAIPGLYAVGNDMSSVMGGYYPSGGITLGPAIAFSYWIAQHV